MIEAVKALLNYRQADEEGIMVLTSRQAIHEVAARIEQLEEALREIATTSADGLPEFTGQAMYAIARAALGEKA